MFLFSNSFAFKTAIVLHAFVFQVALLIGLFKDPGGVAI